MANHPDGTIDAMARWLLAHMPELRQHDGAGEAVRTITGAVASAQRAIDRPPERVYAGPCPSCGTDLLGKPGMAMVTCAGCGSTYDVGERQAVMRAQLSDVLGNASWCAAAANACGLRVSPGTIRVWASRHRLGQRPGGMYRFGDVVTLVIERDAAQAR